MYKILGLMLASILILTACGSAPQVIDIISTPSGAYVDVNGENVGKTPCSYEVPNYLDYYAILKFKAEKSNYEADMKSIKRNPDGNYPKQISFVLEAKKQEAPGVVPGVAAPVGGGSGGGGQQFGQQATPTVTPTTVTPTTTTTQMMGPTIVVPGGPTFQQGQQGGGEHR